jgi:hypothetical protein
MFLWQAFNYANLNLILYSGHSYAKSYFLDVTHLIWLRQSILLYNEYTCVKNIINMFFQVYNKAGNLIKTYPKLNEP